MCAHTHVRVGVYVCTCTCTHASGCVCIGVWSREGWEALAPAFSTNLDREKMENEPKQKGTCRRRQVKITNGRKEFSGDTRKVASSGHIYCFTGSSIKICIYRESGFLHHVLLLGILWKVPDVV